MFDALPETFARPPAPAAFPAPRRRGRGGRVAGLAGRAAEETTARLYAGRGWRVVARNWRAGRDWGGGEIDLVVEKDGVLAFVEVKARRTLDAAARSLRPAQRRRLTAAAERFLMLRDAGGRDIRFDVALLDRAGRLEVVENAIID